MLPLLLVLFSVRTATWDLTKQNLGGKPTSLIYEKSPLRATPLLLLPAVRQESSLVCSVCWIFRWSDIYYAAWNKAGTTKQDSSPPPSMPLIYKNLQSNCYPTTLKFLVRRKKWRGGKRIKKFLSRGTSGLPSFTSSSKKRSEDSDSQSLSNLRPWRLLLMHLLQFDNNKLKMVTFSQPLTESEAEVPREADTNENKISPFIKA